MATSLFQLMTFLIAGIAVIILLTAKYKVHAFFALMIACFVVGLGVQMPVAGIIKIMKEGFGHIMQSLGFIIVVGTTLGILLEHTGSTHVMADWILKKTGEKRAALAMNITGFVVGLPIFCDSGYIVLSGLNKSLAYRTRIAMPVMATSMAAGLYAVHCLIPPHPGASAAAGIMQVDFGKLILLGIAVAVPASIVGYIWAGYAGRKMKLRSVKDDEAAEMTTSKPGVLRSFLPVIIPILLIGLGAFGGMEKKESGIWQILSVTGNPVIALCIGVLLALTAVPSWNKREISRLLQDGAEKAGGILVIIGAGGAFGAILAATNIGQHLEEVLPLGSLGIFFPFLLTALLKTAQGSSTVAIITAASIVQPLLPALGLNTPAGQMLCVLSMGGGSMMISHANDAYFWVISKFSGLEMNTMLRVYSVATIWMGLTTLLCVYLLSLWML
ncbi:MAG: GntP family permease [Chitinophagaceae bacterium]|nr:GntP family permease [Chitinophagaceae bacterium]